MKPPGGGKRISPQAVNTIYATRLANRIEVKQTTHIHLQGLGQDKHRAQTGIDHPAFNTAHLTELDAGSGS